MTLFAQTLFAQTRLLDSAGDRTGWLRVAGGRIAALGEGSSPAVPGGDDGDVAEVVRGGILAPAFLDLHVHGGGGASVDRPEAVGGVLDAHAAGGTGGAVLSLVSAPLDALVALLTALRPIVERDPRVLGVHLEGPFLAPGRRGAHDPAALAPPAPGAVDALLEAGAGTLRRVTLAPELPGGLDAIARFAAAGVEVGVGHTEADYDLTREAFRRGARSLTHAFNAMPGILGRAPGPVAAAIDDGSAVLELILDGQHVAPGAARLLFAAAPGRVALVTDAMAGACAAPGRYRLGTVEVDVTAERAVLAGGGALAGSTLTTAAALARALREGIDPVAAIAALTTVPAALLDRPAPLLQVGAVADLVLLDESGAVRRRILPGR
ncbi:MAG: nagA [Naasia sp.]|nr:nagA [Naasia sp.]